MKPYSESHFCGDIKIVKRLNFYTEMIEKIKSWDRCKICDGAEGAGGQAWLLIKIEGQKIKGKVFYVK